MATKPELTGSPLRDLTAFQRDLLVTLSQMDEPNGLEVKDEIEAAYGGEVNHGRLYPNLDTLVEKTLVDKGEVDKRTNYYTVTYRGTRELAAHRDWMEDSQ